MSPEVNSFLESLAGVDVASETVPPSDRGEAIEEFVVGDAVGIPGSDWPGPLPDAVDWDPTPAALREAATGVTEAALGIADYGSVVLPTSPPAAELVSLYVDRHVAVLDAADVAPDMEAAIDHLAGAVPDRYGDAILATGPSATADMGALVTGAHGPSEVRVVLVED